MRKFIPEEVFPPQVYYTNTPLARPTQTAFCVLSAPLSKSILRPLGALLSESILHPLSRLDGIGHCCRFLRQAGFTSSGENENLDDDECLYTKGCIMCPLKTNRSERTMNVDLCDDKVSK